MRESEGRGMGFRMRKLEGRGMGCRMRELEGRGIAGNNILADTFPGTHGGGMPLDDSLIGAQDLASKRISQS